MGRCPRQGASTMSQNSQLTQPWPERDWTEYLGLIFRAVPYLSGQDDNFWQEADELHNYRPPLSRLRSYRVIEAVHQVLKQHPPLSFKGLGEGEELTLTELHELLHQEYLCSYRKALEEQQCEIAEDRSLKEQRIKCHPFKPPHS